VGVAVKVIDLCGFDPFCTREATHAVILRLGRRKGPPIKVCGMHLEETRQRAGKNGVFLEIAPLELEAKPS